MDNIIYFHIPKTAGSTINHLMIQNCGKEKLLHIHNLTDLAFLNDSKIAEYNYISGHIGFAFSSRIEPSFKMFTFLRDPVERVISLYYYWKNSPQLFWHNKEDGKMISNPSHQYTLDKFLDLGFINGPVMKEVLNLQTWQMFYDFEMSTRLKFRNTPESEILQKAKENINRMDFVGFTEDFENSVTTLCHLFDWKRPDQIPKIRVTQNKPAIDDIDPCIIEKIKSLVYLDQELYSYVKSLYQ